MDSYIKMYRKSKDINEDYRHLYGINLLDQEQLQKVPTLRNSLLLFRKRSAFFQYHSLCLQ